MRGRREFTVWKLNRRVVPVRCDRGSDSDTEFVVDVIRLIRSGAIQEDVLTVELHDTRARCGVHLIQIPRERPGNVRYGETRPDGGDASLGSLLHRNGMVDCRHDTCLRWAE
jgi:hypothetical protein